MNSALQESQTFDEGTHLAAGFAYWTEGRFDLNVEHPPLGKLLCALPLLWTPARIDRSSDAWKIGEQTGFGTQFLYSNALHADTLLMRARAATIAMTLALGFVLAAWVRSRWGAGAGLTAVALLAFDPNFLAHGHYVTSDVPVSLFIFLAAAAWHRYLRTWRAADLALAALALGLALATKYSALFLLPLHLLTGLVAAIRVRRSGFLFGYPAVVAGAAVVLAASYGGATVGAVAKDIRRPLASLRAHHPYVQGFNTLRQHNRDGHPSYLLGRKIRHGDWRYFPVAFGVKTPTATWALLPAALLAVRGQWMLAAYPAAYLAISMGSSINLGLRHILPVYPFLFALIAAGIGRLRGYRAGVLVLAAGLHLYELAGIHPHYLAFFNIPSGGPGNGPRYLLDSNIDWGQDLKKLQAHMEERGIPKVYIAYFGMAPPRYYGIVDWGLAGVGTPADVSAIDGFAAISVTNLYDVYFDDPTYVWLRKYEPAAKIGYSIYVYDFRDRRPVP